MKPDKDVKPLVVCGSDGAPIDLVYENKKGFKKSIEQAVLWSLHRESGKLLPYGEGSLTEITDNGSWYLARVSTENVAVRADFAPPEGGSNKAPGDRSDPQAERGSQQLTAAVNIGEVLQSLATVIRQRNKDRPDGSYTTHLLESGEMKIRKKLGEEAVEILLASNRDELVAETSDFLYHLLVLCEVSGVTLDDIAAELARR